MQEIIEIYNLKIHNYPKHAVPGGIQFGNLEKSKDLCGKVRIYNNPSTFYNDDPSVKNDSILLSQDPLNSVPSLKNKYYKLYKNERAKMDRLNTNYKFDLDKFKILLNSTICIYKKNLIHYKPSINVDTAQDSDMIRNNLDNISHSMITEQFFNDSRDANDQEGYIRKINITKNDKIIIFGDFHGSFHTFFRTMLRLHIYGVLDIETYKIKDNYKLIFLGDILDRGQYSLEIFEILFRFIHNDTNNDKIIINRGNHESIISFIYGFFTNELKNIITNLEERLKFFNNILYFIRLCPSAIILHNSNTNKNYWLCHGCIPSNNNIDCKITDLIKDNLDVLRVSNIKEIMWNDPTYDKSKNIFETTDGRGPGMYTVGLNRLCEFRKNTNIHFIIRGHNDFYANATLFTNKLILKLHQPSGKIEDLRFFILGDKTMYNPNAHFLTNNLSTKLSLNDQYIDGSVENIFMNGDWSIDNEQYPCTDLKVYPLLTISTNTDKDRPLTCDSFIVLHTTDDLNYGNNSVFKITQTDIKDYLNTNDPESLINTIIAKPFLLEQSELKNNKDFLLKAFHINPQVLEYSDLKNDQEFLKLIDPSRFMNKYIKYKTKYLYLKK
jgi:hypothetical protein